MLLKRFSSTYLQKHFYILLEFSFELWETNDT